MAELVHDHGEKYLKMPLDTKRTGYKCGKNFTTLDNIETWASMFQNMEDTFKLNTDKTQKHHDAGLGPFKASPSLSQKVSLWRGDITCLEIDAIVNAANKSLLGGGGVDGAIHVAAGPELKSECQTLNGCQTGEAKITGGYRLPAKYVIHTVGPIGEQPVMLKKCYQNCLELLVKEQLRSVALPCISTGIYGYPPENAAKIALQTVRDFLEEKPDSIDRVIFCLFLPTDVEIYRNLMQIVFPQV